MKFIAVVFRGGKRRPLGPWAVVVQQAEEVFRSRKRRNAGLSGARFTRFDNADGTVVKCSGAHRAAVVERNVELEASAMAKKRKTKRKVVPRLGPPVNLRPAGAHKEKRRRTRSAEKRAVLMEDVPAPEPSRHDDEG